MPLCFLSPGSHDPSTKVRVRNAPDSTTLFCSHPTNFYWCRSTFSRCLSSLLPLDLLLVTVSALSFCFAPEVIWAGWFIYCLSVQRAHTYTYTYTHKSTHHKCALCCSFSQSIVISKLFLKSTDTSLEVVWFKIIGWSSSLSYSSTELAAKDVPLSLWRAIILQ